MNISQRITNYFIGENLEESKEFYVKAKIGFMFRVHFTSIFIFSTLCIIRFFTGQLISSLILGFGSVFSLGLLFLLKKTKNELLVTGVFVTFFITIINIGLLFDPDVVGIVIGFWSLALVLLAFFMLEKAWGVIVSIATFFPFIIYLNTERWIDNINMFAQFDSIDWLITSIEIFGASALIVYTAIVFMSTIKNAEEKLKEADEFKASLLKEIHHRVKNNFAMVISLLRIQGNEVDDEKMKSILQVSEDRIRVMSLLHERIYKEGDFSNVDARNHINALVNDLISTYSAKGEVQCDIDIEEIKFGMKTTAPLGFILNELITNSLKHAFPEGKKGHIKIQLSRLEDEYELMYSDDGIGIQDSNKENSLGMELINVFVGQLDGAIQKLETKGAEYKIIFRSIG